MLLLAVPTRPSGSDNSEGEDQRISETLQGILTVWGLETGLEFQVEARILVPQHIRSCPESSLSALCPPVSATDFARCYSAMAWT